MGESPLKKTTLISEGIVRSFDDGSGNGFIARDSDTDVFVNREAIRGDGPRTLAIGARVRVEVMEGPHGPRAVSVRRS
jgi:CspA family cold shock protein